MDRRYGGDPLAPPRPPKSLPRVHRPRAPEPLIMNESLQQQNQQQRTQQQQQQHLHSSNIVSHHHTTTTTTTTTGTINPIHHHTTNIVLTQAPTTAPLVSLQSSTSFSRRRPPPQALTIPTISSFSSNIQESPLTPVTLAAPRPENERLGNEYVDTPFRTPNIQLASRIGGGGIGAGAGGGGGGSHPHNAAIHIGQLHLPPPAAHPNHQQHHHPHSNQQQTQTANFIHSSLITGSPKPIVPHHSTSQQLQHQTSVLAATATTTTAPPPSIKIDRSGRTTAAIRPTALPVQQQAITKQPLSSFTKDLPTAALHEDIDIHPSNGDALNSITCPQCKRCRCEECQRPRQLPQTWICDNTCLCSAETIIDYTTCLCCVKALFYHCSKDHEMERDGDSISCADNPCSCLPHKRSQRWAWLGALSFVLPCLWCYWPMRGCVALCAKCYARHTRHGCRCPQNKLSLGNLSGGSGAGILGSGSGGGGISGVGISVGGGGGGSHGIGRTISRTCDLTPEKRLLDSSPEY